MNIGIDIDDTISETFETLLPYAQKYTIEDLKRKSEIDINQDFFIPQNDFDIRVIVTGNKAIAIKRMNRKNDFRASGSGYILYDKNEIDIRCVKIAFEVNKKL